MMGIAEPSLVWSEMEPATPFLRFKGVFYTLRIIRELVPAVLVSVSFHSIFSAFLSSAYNRVDVKVYDSAVGLSPGRSTRFDKMIWQTIVQAPEYAALRWDYFNNDFERISDWRTDADDNWWCLVHKLPHLRPPFVNGSCGIPRERVTCEPANRSSYFRCGYPLDYPYMERTECFPRDDEGWRCLLPPQYSSSTDASASAESLATPPSPPAAAARNWPLEPEVCYSVCLDVSGTRPHYTNVIPFDLYYLLICPVLGDALVLLLFVHATTIVAALSGKPISRKLYLGWGSVGAASLLTALILAFPGVIKPFTICQPWLPLGTPVTILLLLVFAYVFLSMSLAHRYPLARCLAWPALKLFSCLLSDKDRHREQATTHAIDSDRALCFYLAACYHTRGNTAKQVMIGLLVYGVMALIIFVIVPIFLAHDPSSEFAHRGAVGFVLDESFTFILLATSIAHSLRATRFPVDYRAFLKKRELYAAKQKDNQSTILTELKSLMDTASNKVKQESCRFLHHEQVDEPAVPLQQQSTTPLQMPLQLHIPGAT